MKYNKETIDKVLDTYLNSSLNLDGQAKSVHIGKKTYKDIVNNNFNFYKVNNREEAWDLYNQVSDETKYYRLIGQTNKSGKIYLLSLAITNDELRYFIEVEGISSKEIADKVNMPFITYKFIHDRAGRLGFKYDTETVKKNRVKGLKKAYSNDEKLDKINTKRRKTMIDRYGADSPMRVNSIKEKQQATTMERYGVPVSTMNKEVQKKQQVTSLNNNGVPFPAQNKEIYSKVIKTNQERYGADTYMLSDEGKKVSKKSMIERYGVLYPMQSQEIKAKFVDTKHNLENNIEFIPTEYVKNAIISKEITSSLDNLKTFLKENFPDKEKFTLAEIANITGRSYNFIASTFRADGNFIIHKKQGVLPYKMQSFLESLGFVANKDFIINDRKAIKPLEIDFYFPKQKVGIEVNDLITHNHTYNPYGNEPKPKDYHMYKSKVAKDNGIRLIHAWEHYFNNAKQYEVLKNAIKHALGISTNRVYARNTYVREVPNSELRDFFNTNNIQGFRGAKTAYALFDKKTNEILMAYSVGSSHFAHNKYDLELIRGASKLDTTIVGGASKLWKFIIDNNPDINSIVYYIDRNIYQGSSISSLEGNLELINTQPGFWNYFVKTGEMKNRQPSKHKEIKEMVANGDVWEVYNAGTETYVWHRE